jgi:hypothetical protein
MACRINKLLNRLSAVQADSKRRTRATAQRQPHCAAAERNGIAFRNEGRGCCRRSGCATEDEW